MSNLADGVFRVALPLLAVRLTDSPGLVAGVAVAQRLPWLVMALPAGALADRLDRRAIMVRVQLLRVVVVAGLAGAVAAGAETIGLLYAAALVLGVGETLFDTSAQSVLPAVVAPDQLSRANGRLFATELTADGFAGPALGGLVAGAALWAALAASSGAYLVAAATLLLVRGTFRPPAGRPRRSMRADIGEGLRFVWHHPVLRTLGLMLGLCNLASQAWFAVFVLYAVAPGPLGLSEAGYGLLVTAGAAGVAGSWLAPVLERRLGMVRCLAFAVVAFALGLSAPVLTHSVPANAVAMAGNAVAIMVWNVITVSLRQRITPPHLLGRMNAAYRLLGWGTMPIGAALGGLLAEGFGLRTAFAVAAAVNLVALAGVPRLARAAAAGAMED